MRYATFGLILALGGGIAVAAADTPSETHEQAALELLELVDFETLMMAGASGMADAMIQQNPMLDPYRDVLLEWAGAFMTKDTFGTSYVALYVEAFTEPELREIAAFYKTPTGRKALAKMPELMQRGMALGAEVASEHLPKLQEMIRERAAELESPEGDTAPE